LVERHDATASVTDSYGSSWTSHSTDKLYWQHFDQAVLIFFRSMQRNTWDGQ